MSDKDSQNNEFATIESYIHDQGGGFSYCSSCNITIVLSSLKKGEGEFYPRCPGCKRQLTFGDVHINRGGSDF